MRSAAKGPGAGQAPTSRAAVAGALALPMLATSYVGAISKLRTDLPSAIRDLELVRVD